MQPFDYEEETIYNLQVIARNVAPPYESDSANVVITVRDINDNAPVFSMPAGYTFNVPEITAINSPIGTAVATDIDGGGLNGTVSCNMLSAKLLIDILILGNFKLPGYTEKNVF